MQMKNVAYLGISWILPGHPGWIGLGRPQFLPDVVRTVEQTDRVAQALGHLGLAIEAGDPLRLGEDGLRLRKEMDPAPKLRVPLPSNLASQLQMLYLIFSHRDQICAIQEDVGCHQNRVVEQPGGHALELL